MAQLPSGPQERHSWPRKPAPKTASIAHVDTLNRLYLVLRNIIFIQPTPILLSDAKITGGYEHLGRNRGNEKRSGWFLLSATLAPKSGESR